MCEKARSLSDEELNQVSGGESAPDFCEGVTTEKCWMQGCMYNAGGDPPVCRLGYSSGVNLIIDNGTGYQKPKQ